MNGGNILHHDQRHDPEAFGYGHPPVLLGVVYGGSY